MATLDQRGKDLLCVLLREVAKKLAGGVCRQLVQKTRLAVSARKIGGADLPCGNVLHLPHAIAREMLRTHDGKRGRYISSFA